MAGSETFYTTRLSRPCGVGLPVNALGEVSLISSARDIARAECDSPAIVSYVVLTGYSRSLAIGYRDFEISLVSDRVGIGCTVCWRSCG